MLTPTQLANGMNRLYAAVKSARAPTDTKQVERAEDEMLEVGFQLLASTLQAVHTIATSLDAIATSLAEVAREENLQ
jgi:hypothetical protein